MPRKPKSVEEQTQQSPDAGQSADGETGMQPQGTRGEEQNQASSASNANIVIEEAEVNFSAEVKDLDKIVLNKTPEPPSDPALVMEFSEDPVRLYLKEIGNIDLLNTDQEFWLSTQIEATRRIDLLVKGHPLARLESLEDLEPEVETPPEETKAAREEEGPDEEPQGGMQSSPDPHPGPA